MADAILVPRVVGPSFGDFTLDAGLNERHTSGGTLTDNPLEEGANVSDHYTESADVVTLDGVWTDTPTEGEPEAGRSSELYRKLRAFKSTGQPVQIVTGLRLYDNMVLENFEVVRNADTGFALPISLSFKQARISSAEVVPIPPEAPQDGAKSASSKVDTGRKATKKPDASTEKQSSVLYDLLF